MSKIDEALSEIKQYLSGNDHSDNPNIRQAAVIYSQACREINSKLTECRQLIDKGLLIDAQRLNRDMQPSLSERAEKLMLPQGTFNRYQELCRLYGYVTAPDIDRPALEKLTQAPDGKEEILKDLLLRWRKTARTGTTRDKLKLLRAILSNAPADDQIWRSNLASVEHQWVKDLQKEADIAIQENAGEKLSQIYMALSDPQLLQPVPPAELEKLQPYVRKYQQEVLKKDLEKKLTELFSAYSTQNFELISERLREYDMMITNPLYTPDAEAEQAPICRITFIDPHHSEHLLTFTSQTKVLVKNLPVVSFHHIRYSFNNLHMGNRLPTLCAAGSRDKSDLIPADKLSIAHHQSHNHLHFLQRSAYGQSLQLNPVSLG